MDVRGFELSERPRRAGAEVGLQPPLVPSSGAFGVFMLLCSRLRVSLCRCAGARVASYFMCIWIGILARRFALRSLSGACACSVRVPLLVSWLMGFHGIRGRCSYVGRSSSVREGRRKRFVGGR